MNNDLEQFSEERLLKIIEFVDQIPEIPATVEFTGDEAKAISRIILAAKQAMPFCYVSTECIKQNVDVGVGVGGGTWAMSQKPYNGGRGFDLVNPLYTTTQPAHTEQDGWKLVPIEPTAKMIGAASGQYMTPIKCWEVMLRASPKPESE